jgi:hypothetical protein
MDSGFRQNDICILLIVIPAKAGIHGTAGAGATPISS